MKMFISNLILVYLFVITSVHTTSTDNNFNTLIRSKRESSPDYDIVDDPIEYDEVGFKNSSVKNDTKKVKVDNHKPVFRNCKSYAPSIKEEEPQGTFVIQVNATDEDGDEIEYSFIQAQSERTKFKIDKKTGVITTHHQFDRDDARDREVYVTVRATDNDHTPLLDVCTFKVTILDINDNAPVFVKSKYEASVSEDMIIGAEVIKVVASDYDDGDNSIVKYEIVANRDYQFFNIDADNGIIYLQRTIDRKPGQFYKIDVRANNTDTVTPQEARIEILIRVIESNKKPPSYIDPPTHIIELKEDFKDYSAPIIELRAQSNIPDKSELVFELLTGRTEQTNSKKTFVFNQHGNSVVITLGKPLDFEAITDYSLTMSVRNNYDLTAEHEIKIRVMDVNDNIPYFTEVTTGTILENEPPGTQVMQVRAFDMDGTSNNNIIKFRLVNESTLFKIDEHTGNITSLVEFDREEKDFYNIKVEAVDNSPSSLFNTNEPNVGTQVFRIEIGDKNDHAPVFENKHYQAEIEENVRINQEVITVKANDIDTAAQITYSITSGNYYDTFRIEDKTGLIRVQHNIDYENRTHYTLEIRAFDGRFDDNTTVDINILNVNDVAPIFDEVEYTIRIKEEWKDDSCIYTAKAYDGDIADRNADQGIVYSINKEDQQDLLGIDNNGCVKLKETLNRDPPNGIKIWQVLINAVDVQGLGESSTMTLTIELEDINDNAPFLTNKMPVVWNENQESGEIVQLTADDYDEPRNGAPFTFEISEDASQDIKSKFDVRGNALHALVPFDREKQKEYEIPISISDNGIPQQSNVSIFHLVIGDINDNEMQEGSSNIFVYNYMGEIPDTVIGRVFVEDLDDWDLPDKEFSWKGGIEDDHFYLDHSNGSITMRKGTRDGTYQLQFTVIEFSKLIARHSVTAYVTVTVREIPEEAVTKSGSIRFYGITAEEFISEQNLGEVIRPSPKDKFRDHIANLFNISNDNVDVFTVLQNVNKSLLDVRFSAHGSPYYEPERLNGFVGQMQNEIETELDLEMYMINIDECLIERAKCGEESCFNFLSKSSTPLTVFTNRTSFVGVNAFNIAQCGECKKPQISDKCLNGGTSYNGRCECPSGFDGPYCEEISIGFNGNGYAMYPSISPCDTTRISLEIIPTRDNGLIMYIGPLEYNSRLRVQDYLALELVNGYPVLIVDYGTGSARIEYSHIKVDLSKSYTFDIELQKSGVEFTVNKCKLSTCMSLGKPQGQNAYLNVNAPLHLGGSSVDLRRLAALFNWTHVPQHQGYSGCIRNLTINDETYNIGAPSMEKYSDPSCQRSVAVAVSFGIDSNFLIAIFVCIGVLLILLLAVVVHRRHHDGWHEKDMDDIRETIINYEDEGGGERDTDYDLNVLRAPPMYEDKPYKNDLLQRNNNMGLMGSNGEVPDIGAFLTDKKDACDKDTDAYPIDDVRHYAYEGDGNSSGSLSSLASCTDEGDLKFNYLSSFGPRFRKLADMYGEEPSDTDSNVDDEEGWRI